MPATRPGMASKPAFWHKKATAHEDIIEAHYSYYNTFTGNQEMLSKDIQAAHSQALGRPWNLVKPGLMFKAYP